MKNDGENYKYVWDAFGRLKEVLDRSDDSLVAEYTYNGLGFRTSEHHDTDTDGDVDANDATYHFVFDERWRIVATYRNDDANPKEQFVYHCAGVGGYGSSSYIDAVILRDVDLSTAWNAQADALDARHYYCQNWRADVSVIIDDSAVLVERIMYSPYGVPFGIPVGDLVGTGGSEPADGTIGTADNTALTGTYWGSSYNIADLDNDGDVDSADQTIQSNNNGATIGWTFLSDTHNRLGYAGYVFDEALAGTKWHVRHRVLESVLGRWISRDPLGYVDGMSLSQYVASFPIIVTDPLGSTWQECRAACFASCDQQNHGFFGRWGCYGECEASCALLQTMPTILGAAALGQSATNSICGLLDWSVNSPATACFCGIVGTGDILIPIPLLDAMDCACNIASALELWCRKGLGPAAWYGVVTAIDCSTWSMAALLAIPTGGWGILADTFGDLGIAWYENWLLQDTFFPEAQCQGCWTILTTIFPDPPPQDPEWPGEIRECPRCN